MLNWSLVIEDINWEANQDPKHWSSTDRFSLVRSACRRNKDESSRSEIQTNEQHLLDTTFRTEVSEDTSFLYREYNLHTGSLFLPIVNLRIHM